MSQQATGEQYSAHGTVGKGYHPNKAETMQHIRLQAAQTTPQIANAPNNFFPDKACAKIYEAKILLSRFRPACRQAGVC
jgi:hypothetical protein